MTLPTASRDFVGDRESDRVGIRLVVSMARDDESLPRLVLALRRRLWSVEELHLQRHDDRDEATLAVSKRGGRPELLVAGLERETRVLSVVRS